MKLGQLDQLETMVLKVSKAMLDLKETLEIRVTLVKKGILD